LPQSGVATFIVKQKAINKEDNPISSSHFPSSTFINFNDYFNEDVCLPMNFNVNVYGSLSPLVLGMSILKGIPLNLDQVQRQSFEIVIDCLKTMFVTPHLSNE
jgi:hypothetical protein